jgi:hypothetical protein
MRVTSPFAAVFLGSLLAFSAVSRGALLADADNLTPVGDAYGAGNAWWIVDLSGTPLTRAVSFTANAPCRIDSIDLALSGDSVAVWIAPDDSATHFPVYPGPGASLLGTLTGLGAPSIKSLPGLGYDLNAGDTYWIILAPAGQDNGATWYANSYDTITMVSYQGNGWFGSAPQYLRGAFRVNASPVPEPACLALLPMAGALLVRRRRLKPTSR